MGTKIARLKLRRKTGYLYYVKEDETGYLCVYEAEMARSGRKRIDKKKKVIDNGVR